MNKAPAFQLYAQDFLTGVMYLTNEEVGIYIRMLCKQWTDGSIPKKRLGFLVGYEWDNLSEELKSKFVENDGRLINTKLEEVRQQKENFLKKQKENGKKGGRPPKNTKSKNPTESQKKPLEVEDEVEIEVKDELVLEKSEKPFVQYPFDSEEFKKQWELWKDFKKKEFKFKYKTVQSEQAALTQLSNLANGNEKTAIAIIHQSFANGWKGFFELKNQPKERTVNRQTREVVEENLKLIPTDFIDKIRKQNKN